MKILQTYRVVPLPGIIFSIFLTAQIVVAQMQIELPRKIKLEVNGSELSLTSGWIDSLVDEAYAGMIHYKIVGAKRSDYYITTQIQIPQILTLNDVMRQIVFYYSLLPNEESREAEILTIFPYFESTDGKPALKTHYDSEGEYNIELFRWNTVPIPNQPIPEHKYIVNQILQTSFSGVQSLGDVPDKVFEEVAIENDLTVEQTRIIYQNTILWKVGKQIRAQ
jgi:hypothetical protein